MYSTKNIHLFSIYLIPRGKGGKPRIDDPLNNPSTTIIGPVEIFIDCNPGSVEWHSNPAARFPHQSPPQQHIKLTTCVLD